MAASACRPSSPGVVLAHWTVEEVRAYLPRLQRLLALIGRSARIAATARTNGHAGAPDRPPAQAPAPPPDQEPSTPEAVDGGGDDTLPADDLAGLSPGEALAELEERGVVLRDVQRGLVDFPCRHPQGKTVLLCWQMGESDLAWWHLPEDGFAGRRPLPLPPEL